MVLQTDQCFFKSIQYIKMEKIRMIGLEDLGWEYSSVEKQLPSICETLGLVLSIIKKEGEDETEEGEEEGDEIQAE